MDDELSVICSELQSLQRNRAAIIKSRIMAENNRRAYIANLLGYSAGQEESKRKEMFSQADDLIADVIAGKKEHPGELLINAAELGIQSFLHAQKATEKEMIPLVKQTPVAEWAQRPEQNGFGLISLATVIGETGDLRLYSNPGKLWRRLGCAPWTYGKPGEAPRTQMGSTWKSKGGLTAEQWSQFGYSPRRRSIVYVIGTCLIKANKGPYRKRFDEVKAAAITGRPDWSACKCEGTGKSERGAKCSGCLGKGYKSLRCNTHAMLLMTKLLLKNLWKQWNIDTDRGEWSEQRKNMAVAV